MCYKKAYIIALFDSNLLRMLFFLFTANRSSLNGVTWITVVALVVVGLLNSPLHIIF